MDQSQLLTSFQCDLLKTLKKVYLPTLMHYARGGTAIYGLYRYVPL